LRFNIAIKMTIKMTQTVWCSGVVVVVENMSGSNSVMEFATRFAAGGSDGTKAERAERQKRACGFIPSVGHDGDTASSDLASDNQILDSYATATMCGPGGGWQPFLPGVTGVTGAAGADGTGAGDGQNAVSWGSMPRSSVPLLATPQTVLLAQETAELLKTAISSDLQVKLGIQLANIQQSLMSDVREEMRKLLHAIVDEVRTLKRRKQIGSGRRL
jgi:hypothetical protein